MPDMDEALRLIRQGLYLGQTFQSGAAQVRVERAYGSLTALRFRQAGRFVAGASVLADAQNLADIEKDRARQRDAILKDLADDVVLLLTRNLADLTGHQYRTLSELAELGHPYAKKHVRDALGRYNPRKHNPKVGNDDTPPPYVVNNQSGALTNDFDFNVLGKDGNYTVLASNSLTYSRLLAMGTDTMIARPYDKEAAELTRVDAAGTLARHAEMLVAVGQNPGLAKMPELDFLLGTVKREYPGK